MKTFELTNANGKTVAYGDRGELKSLAKLEKLITYFITPIRINVKG